MSFKASISLAERVTGYCRSACAHVSSVFIYWSLPRDLTSRILGCRCHVIDFRIRYRSKVNPGESYFLGPSERMVLIKNRENRMLSIMIIN